jgi:lysophospholipase L1-like esterase
VFTPQPDYVCINIGTNDQCNGVAVAAFIGAYTALLDDILSASTTQCRSTPRRLLRYRRVACSMAFESPLVSLGQ